MNPGAASLVRLYMNADDLCGKTPLYEAVVAKARELGLAGASVFAAELGYGGHGVIHDVFSEYTFVHSPIVVEVVDEPERIARLIDAFRSMIGEGIVTVSTVSPVRVARYAHPPTAGGTD